MFAQVPCSARVFCAVTWEELLSAPELLLPPSPPQDSSPASRVSGDGGRGRRLWPSSRHDAPTEPRPRLWVPFPPLLSPFPLSGLLPCLLAPHLSLSLQGSKQTCHPGPCPTKALRTGSTGPLHKGLVMRPRNGAAERAGRMPLRFPSSRVAHTQGHQCSCGGLRLGQFMLPNSRGHVTPLPPSPWVLGPSWDRGGDFRFRVREAFAVHGIAVTWSRQDEGAFTWKG